MRIYLLIATLLLTKQAPVSCVRLLELQVPAQAAEGGEAILGCQFDMERDILYSVKWYKDGREFYRYVHDSQRPINHFATPGVMVDVRRSSSTVVTLVHLTRESAGLYRCEVSGEAPLFATVHEEKYITIYLLPETKPILTGLKEKYDVGDRIRANCTSSGSRPEAQLKWLINNKLVGKNYIRGPWYRATMRDDVTETILELKFTVGSHHFNFDTMELKCQATIAPLYQQETVYQVLRKDIPPLDSFTDMPELGEQPLPTFPHFGDTSKLPLENETDAAGTGLHLDKLLVLFILLLINL
ncbi:cell adhesion molecule 2 [Papilio machaon]|uniref:cell adhesion molecule 2 n=1 Tax=Papilio machaon TaxID=76193 RepID=UPI001E663935|nr:cell adhesion molecule 2 [Papilio machaon]